MEINKLENKLAGKKVADICNFVLENGDELQDDKSVNGSYHILLSTMHNYNNLTRFFEKKETIEEFKKRDSNLYGIFISELNRYISRANLYDAFKKI